MISVDILGESRYRFNRGRIRQAVASTLLAQRITSDVELSVVVVGRRKMATLNKKYRQKDEATEVLAFPLEGVNYPDEVLRLGDIVICYPLAVEQAQEQNRLVDEVIADLVAHGCQNLLS